MKGAPKGMPLPAVNSVTEPFWTGCAGHKLLVQRCKACGTHWHAPSPLCGNCQSRDYAWEESKGAGAVYSFFAAHYAVHSSLKDQVPYGVVAVKLDDCGGVCITSNLLDTEPGDIRIGMRVKVAWEDMGQGITLPRFVRA